MDALRESPLTWDYGIREPCSYESLHLTRRVKGC